ncbi:tRNA uridine-5-carboxymethylaminomethyl(34) synthesis GTPase MnmE [Prevotella intermedia]|uniref:tRNA modification GTPase MnmE n=1 Tax=Prevotella intermedia TaxID=28131 RepID=A0A2G8ICP6_PREIN|nr:tRNA uridine-5-carboxymethylaminomethyl(34) synthesis GTPase MnmE [Prevotella intermedia]PIK21286.1 tRNA uridine-5-carboxymethylaminomethyl(34) synthesis GTPase MnmE [Prevotella intermedia]
MQVYNNLLNSSETICALATQPGGAIGVIRVSGSKAIEIVDSIFSRPILNAPANTLHYGEILDKDHQTIDEVVVSIWRAPHSYTGEDSVEISCHGSAYILEQVLHRLIESNCRQAKPGEYTQRAYLNGKMDLSQTEAVADLIASTNKASYKLALSQLKGHFSSELSTLRSQLLKINSLLELELDFSDHEELEFADRTELIALSEEIDRKVTTLARSFKTGQALRNGIPVAIIGKTNVGKSTLLNRLLRDNRAIVSDIHGTTRDIIEDTISINGVDFHFIDTAGIRKTTDYVEQLGIERTLATLEKAQIVLWVVDNEPTESEKKEILAQCTDKHLILVHNKADDLTEPTNQQNHTATSHDSTYTYHEIAISGKYNLGINQLEALIYKVADLPEITENTTIVTNARHYDALTRAHASLLRVQEAMAMNLSGDLISEDLKDTISILAEITGDQITPQETLHNIFKHFCIGK